MRLNRLLLIILIIAPQLLLAVPKSLPIPRFVSLKFDTVNTRVGPDKKFAIKWVFVNAKEPVEVIAEHEQWRKIRDVEGEGGWVHSSVLSGRRSVVIKGNRTVNLLDDMKIDSQIIAYLKPNLRCSLVKIKDSWCKINCNQHVGWVLKEHLWGVYPNE